jgi:hypothetical protein
MTKYRQLFGKFCKEANAHRKKEEYESLDLFIMVVDSLFDTHDTILANGHTDGLAHVWVATSKPADEAAAAAETSTAPGADEDTIKQHHDSENRMDLLAFFANDLLNVTKWQSEYEGGQHEWIAGNTDSRGAPLPPSLLHTPNPHPIPPLLPAR